ncbi:MAG: hypothetical protein KDA21_14130, partial [Phycisphaerales bacterium]|nr:hypothetical protein [Phycisphaerales bacterium]
MRDRSWVLMLLSLGVLLPGTVHAGVVWHVRADSPPGGDGQSWSGAFADLQQALALAGAGDEVWVASGTYTPDGGNGDRNAAFWIPDGLTLRGGFTGTELSPDDRPASGSEVILSGEIGDSQTTLDNAYHVVRMEVFFGSAALEQVTITGGHADGAGNDGQGGGVRVRLSDVTFTRCRFVSNWAMEGGGLYSTSGVPTLIDCQFEDNFADGEGGGALLEDFARVRGCGFTGNTAGFGGGLTLCCGDPLFTEVRVEDCDFVSNFADYGGGLFIPNGFARVVGSRFLNNGASRGGGVYNASADGVLSNCFIAGGFADQVGAVM